MALVLIWVAALFWSMSPLLGWGSYTDRMYGTCEIDWAKANFSTIYKSYIVSIFICCFFLPVLVMVFSYVSIINTVKSSHALASDGDPSERQRRMERDVTRVFLYFCCCCLCAASLSETNLVSFVICTAFIIAWSPYAVISMWSASGYAVPRLTSILASLFAKSASFYNPLIYFGMCSKFRKDLHTLLPCATENKDPVKLKRFKHLKHKQELLQSARKQKHAAEGQAALPTGLGSLTSTIPLQTQETHCAPLHIPEENSDVECDRL